MLPLWFLILSLFLPRLALFIDWAHFCRYFPLPFYQPWSALLWALVPRVIILTMIYREQGVHFWFLTHLTLAIIVYHRLLRVRWQQQ